MSRIAWLLILVACIIAIYFGVTQYQKSYEVLPAKLPAKPHAPMFGGWQEFTTKKFSVLLPTLPQNAKEKVQNRLYDMYVAEKEDGTIFMISLIDFNQVINPEKTKAILNAIMEDLLSSNPENELKSSNMDTFENVTSLNFTIQNKQIIMKGRAFLEGQTLYVLTYISKLTNKSEDEYKFFINSFHLMKPEKKG